MNSLPIESGRERLISRAAEAAQQEAAWAARRLAAIADALQRAREHPTSELPPGSLAPEAAPAPEEIEFAVRSMVSELAVTLGLSEDVVRAQAHEADVLRGRLPRTWRAFSAGAIGYPKARVIAEQAMNLPDAPEMNERFDAELSTEAAQLTVVKLRRRARQVREALHEDPLQQRHDREALERRVWVEPADDGMAWLHAYLSADDAFRGLARIDAYARQLADPEDARTLAQKRADVLGDILVARGTDHEVRATVAITVPVMTLLGNPSSERPASLEGMVPIAPETARRLAAAAPSLIRILTDPIDSSVLDVGRRSYRPPADLRRFVEIRDGGCRFPGCNRASKRCDIDHVDDWASGGSTSADNLAVLCRGHHRIKHMTRWTVRRDDAGKLMWTSPGGASVLAEDPVPF